MLHFNFKVPGIWRLQNIFTDCLYSIGQNSDYALKKIILKEDWIQFAGDVQSDQSEKAFWENTIRRKLNVLFEQLSALSSSVGLVDPASESKVILKQQFDFKSSSMEILIFKLS